MQSVIHMKEIFMRGLRKLRRALFPTDRELEYQRWLSEGGDAKLRFDYPLNPESLVIDVGGFTGQWASDIYARFNCRILVLEPVCAFAGDIRARFQRNPRIEVYDLALGASSRTEYVALCGDSTSAFGGSGHRIEIRYEDAAVFFDTHSLSKVDLMKINCEGGEYELLERLLDTGIIKLIRNVQVQFHEVSIDSSRRMAAIQQRLARTHTLTYQYRFLWENWTSRSTDKC